MGSMLMSKSLLVVLMGAFATVTAPAAAQTGALPTWTHFPGISGAGSGGAVVADFDRDGREEVLVNGGRFDGYYSPLNVGALYAFGKEDGVYRFEAMVRVPALEYIQTLMEAPDPAAEPFRVFALLAQWDDSSARRLVVFEGADLRMSHVLDLPNRFNAREIKDVDADGALEILGSDRNGDATVLDFATGAVEFAVTEFSSSGFKSAQFDTDPALELMLLRGLNGPIQILDGATHAVEWVAPSGYGFQVEVGNFDGDAGTLEIASILNEFSRVFATSPGYGVLATPYLPGHPQSSVYDIDGDGRDELLLSRLAVDALTGAEIYEYLTPPFDVKQVRAGEFDDRPGPEVMLIGSDQGLGGSIVVFDPFSLETLHREVSSGGQFSTTLLADLDRDGAEELMLAVRNAHFRGVGLKVIDPRTGALLREREDIAYPNQGGLGMHLLAANLDQDPQLELVVAGSDYGDMTIEVFDGLSLALQWTYARREIRQTYFRAASLLDANGDAALDIAAAADGRVIVVDGATGNLLWETLRIGTGQFDTTLGVHSLDADPAREIVLTEGAVVYVFDAETHLLQGNYAATATVLGQQVEGSGADCRLILFYADFLERRSCIDGQIDTTRPYARTGMQFVRTVSDSHGDLVISDGRELLLQHDDSIAASSSGLGPALGYLNRGALRASGATGVTVYTGDQLALYRLDLDAMRIFGSGFD